MQRLDPRAKLICLVIYAAVAVGVSQWNKLLILAGLMILVHLIARSSLRQFISDSFKYWVFYPIIILIHGFINPGDPLFSLTSHLSFSVTGLIIGLFFAAKFIIIISFIAPVMRSTPPNYWVRALKKLLPAHRSCSSFAETLGFAVQMLPLVMFESQRIREAQVNRGLLFGGGIRNRIRKLVPLVVPLLTLSLQRADRVTLALAARGYSLNKPRSEFKPLKFGPVDASASLIFATAILLIVML